MEDRVSSGARGIPGARPRHLERRGRVEPRAASTRDSLLGYLAVLDRRLVDTGKSTSLYLSGGAAVVLAYGSTERTKDVDAFVAQRNEVLDELQAWAGKNTAVARREGYFFEVVPPIYPVAPGMFDRALPIAGLSLQAIK